MAAALIPRELASWSLGTFALAALEGGVLGVIVKNQFAAAAAPPVVNFCVAVVAGAPAFANLSSFLFASLAMGRDKVAVLSRLMQLMGACLLVMALPGESFAGLVLFCVMTVIARMAWSGILTVRAAVWRANYQRRWRGQVTAGIVQVTSLMTAGFSALIGAALDWHGDAYRLMFPLAAGAAVAASLVYRRARVRRHGQLIRSELAEQAVTQLRGGLRASLGILRENRDFRRYMVVMMVFGSGNLMVIPMMVVLLNEQFTLARLPQVMITSSLPLVLLCFTVRPWARLFDANHIFTYRAIHSWFFVSATAVFLLAAVLRETWLLWPGSVLLGVAHAGGHLGWNLGHNDFTDDARSSLYMAVHVTLTGLRGLVMPIGGVMFYQLLAGLWPALAPWSLLLPLLLSFTGSAWFVWLHRERR